MSLRRRRVAAAALAALTVCVVVVGVRAARGDGEPTTQVGPVSTSTTTATTTAAPSPTTSARPTLPDYRSTGDFSRSPTGTPVRGRSTGQLVTYRVEVERGSGVTTSEFAATIDRTLRHERGWTRGGHWRFQRIVRHEPDVTIRLATPRTVDRACGAAGADTDGYTSCRAGSVIWLNLDRWYIGVPHVPNLHTYRAYLINHEVGHALGRGHERCPGRGRPAPVMVQQTLVLGGCIPNAWPRTPGGREITGPPAE